MTARVLLCRYCDWSAILGNGVGGLVGTSGQIGRELRLDTVGLVHGLGGGGKWWSPAVNTHFLKLCGRNGVGATHADCGRGLCTTLNRRRKKRVGKSYTGTRRVQDQRGRGANA